MLGLSGGPDRTRICDLYRIKVAFRLELQTARLQTKRLSHSVVARKLHGRSIVARILHGKRREEEHG